MSQLNLLWKGRIPLEKVEWELDRKGGYKLSPELETKREEIWQKIVTDYPDSYDGSLLVLNDFSINSKSAFLKMGFIRFSRILTLEKFKSAFHKYGCMGVQSLIFSPKKTHILLGQRSEELMYCPLYYSGPGGMLETADAENPFQDAIMREVVEEVQVDFQLERYLVTIAKDLYTKVGVCFLVECEVAEPFNLSASVEGNEEWSDNQLLWYPIEDVRNLEESLFLESPVFVRDEWELYQTTGESVLWP
jgi:ADP-ribose pyrophosphatase YjhB (NUDIX family)